MVPAKNISVKPHVKRVVIGPMAPDDWEAVRAIYADGIATGQATFETEVPAWESWDASHLPFARLVARLSPAILGWAALSAVSKRAAYAGVAEVSVYVTDGRRGQGVGRALLTELITESKKARHLEFAGGDVSGKPGQPCFAFGLRLSRSRTARTHWPVAWSLAGHDIA